MNNLFTYLTIRPQLDITKLKPMIQSSLNFSKSTKTKEIKRGYKLPDKIERNEPMDKLKLKPKKVINGYLYFRGEMQKKWT